MVLGVRPSPIYVNNIETDDSRKAQENWENQNSQAYGNLMLCIFADIRNLATKAGRDTTKDLLDWLKTQYGTTSISAAYSDVVAVDKLRIPGDCNPTPTLDKLLALFTRLEDNKLIYMEAICAMTLLAKLPPQMEEIARSYNQKSSDTLSLFFAAIRNDVILNWQQRSSKGKQRTPQQSFKVKKLSNVQCKGKDP